MQLVCRVVCAARLAIVELNPDGPALREANRDDAAAFISAGPGIKASASGSTQTAGCCLLSDSAKAFKLTPRFSSCSSTSARGRSTPNKNSATSDSNCPR